MRFLHLLFHRWRHKVWLERARKYVGKTIDGRYYNWRDLPDHIEKKLDKHLWAINRLSGCTLMSRVDDQLGRVRRCK